MISINKKRSPNITAAILAGGLGTRLRPSVTDIPKVLAPVGDSPFITFLLDQLATSGIRKVVLLTGYRGAQVRETLGTKYRGMTLAYSVETSPLGTGGALRQALPLLNTENVLLLNGDSYGDVDLTKLIAAHHQRRADATLTVTHVADAARFGQIQIGSNSQVIGFNEKRPNTGPGWINAGIYVLNKSLLQELSSGENCSLERDLLPGWVHSRPICAFKTQGRFLDIGTPEDYARAEKFFHHHCVRLAFGKSFANTKRR